MTIGAPTRCDGLGRWSTKDLFRALALTSSCVTVGLLPISSPTMMTKTPTTPLRPVRRNQAPHAGTSARSVPRRQFLVFWRSYADRAACARSWQPRDENKLQKSKIAEEKEAQLKLERFTNNLERGEKRNQPERMARATRRLKDFGDTEVCCTVLQSSTLGSWLSRS
jgi:hypothetical protein